ncbi:DUF4474 domain-containing protein [Desulfosporosinus sp. BG]|uniref:DUF4474 domain-containing protein n=1 Tax=Desulfosporosinus sp. BG TaxID=1633135 RepID=UPI00083A6AA4|nr:DUF4474 domain-containing protein [Desulfosporosinus sp. BG]ODA39075.1 hypothetical protein DSBG_4149 [Desulfosporosinus sp. BG]
MSVQILEPKSKTVTYRDVDESDSVPVVTGNHELDNMIEIAGYSYDLKQDIFYSTMDPWQRNIGYCRLYDEAAALMGMIIDCEPIHFDYLDKKWMIGLWKGQYDLVTGCEIGVYTDAHDLNILGLFNGAYYNCASNNDLLEMKYTLKKNGNTLFTREGEHWWLTGFKLGEFSGPSELTMDIDITLHNVLMRDAFIGGLWNAGYSLDQFTRNGNTVSFTFDIPHTPPPMTRTPTIERIMQWKNEQLCNKYQEITGKSNNMQDKLKAVKELAPEMYPKIIRTGKSSQLYEMFLSRLTPQPANPT